MINLRITEVGQIMSHLLSDKSTLFNNFLFAEADISMAAEYHIDGHINPAFFSDEDWAQMEADALAGNIILSRRMLRFSAIKSQLFSIIKGTKTPTAFSIILYAPDELITHICDAHFKDLPAGFTPANISGMMLSLRYSQGALSVITGTSLSVFIPDKTVEHLWDNWVKTFLSSANISFDEI